MQQFNSNKRTTTTNGESFLFHTEDDWIFYQQYSISDILSVLKTQVPSVDQMLFLRHEHCNVPSASVNGITFWPHVYNTRDTRCPTIFTELRDKMTQNMSLNAPVSNGCWWPNFSLNPGICKVSSFGEQRFDESLPSTVFEYEMSLRLTLGGFKVAALGLKLSHCASVSAYILNDEHRLFDKFGCGNHRMNGGDPNCDACKIHKNK